MASFLLLAQMGQAQGPIHQGWTALEDSEEHIEVSYSVQTCGLNSSKILLTVFNEKSTLDTVDFTITIADSSQTNVDYSVSDMEMDGGEYIQATCATNSNSPLVVPVPSGFGLSSLTISIEYE